MKVSAGKSWSTCWKRSNAIRLLSLIWKSNSKDWIKNTEFIFTLCRLLLLTCWPWFWVLIVWFKMNYTRRVGGRGFTDSAARLSFCLLICPSCFIEPVFLRLLVFEVELRHPIEAGSQTLVADCCNVVHHHCAPTVTKHFKLRQIWWRFDSSAHSLWTAPHWGQRCDGFISLVGSITINPPFALIL